MYSEMMKTSLDAILGGKVCFAKCETNIYNGGNSSLMATKFGAHFV